MTMQEIMATPVFRFAPSPNGHLHLGHALSALINFDMARAAGGRLLLRIAAGDPYALRLDMAAALARAGALSWTETGAAPPGGSSGSVAALPEQWGDVVLARKETPTSYHLAVVVDDACQGVTHVVRGQDLFWATSVHRLLQALLGLPAPIYHHHRLILDADGRKLSKSTHATGVRALRESGATPGGVRRMVGLG